MAVLGGIVNSICVIVDMKNAMITWAVLKIDKVEHSIHARFTDSDFVFTFRLRNIK